MEDELVVSAYGSHNASVAMYYKGQYRVIEVERWLSKKNAGLISYLPAAYPQIVFDEITDFLLAETDRSEVDLYLTNYNDLNRLKPKFSYKKHKRFDHHEAHAATAFYQSPYEKAITFTYDGGGDAGFFNVYMTDRQNGVELIERFNQDLGFAYMILADYLADIRRDPLNIGNLVYAGKLMGLCSYGKVREEWVPFFTEFYETFNYHGNSYIGGAEAAKDAVPKLFKQLGVENFNDRMRFEGEFAWDIAATTQHVFEEQFYKFAQPYFDKYPDLPVTMAGGCALNVILNARIMKDLNGKVFVPPNTNDCGIAVGGLLLHQKPELQVDLTYSGTPILDDRMFSSYVENNNFSIVEEVTPKALAEFIHLGNIVGVINGNSEHGPRALGNRSILCNPVGDMKDVLNKKVKNREWYRPFAPVVRLQDAPTYFEFPEGVQSRHMTFVAKIREEFRDKLPAITHEDNTGRIQTVTEKQNPFLYELLTEFSNISDHSVLLNTSFNINGKPILTRLSEALELLNTTRLDAVFYKNKLIFRRGEEEKFTKNIISENIQPPSDATTVYLMMYEDMKNIELYKQQISNVIDSEQKNIVLVGEPDLINGLRKEFKDTVEYFELTKNLLYYHEAINETFERELNALEFAPVVRLLWMKNIMYKNFYRTKNHMFVSLDSYDKTVSKQINLVTNLAREEDKVVIDSGMASGFFKDSDFERMVSISSEVPKIRPQFNMIWGSIESIEWLSVNYEGQLLNALRGGIIGDDTDFGFITYLKCPERFKLI